MLRRRLGLLVAVMACVGAALTGAAPARSAPLSACTADRGTIVAVDFAHWGGPVVRGCVIGARTGYDLLLKAGFSVAGDAQDGDSFVCRLGNRAFRRGTPYPTPSQDPCVTTPPASAYWSYWLASAGQKHWSYAQLGPLADRPRPGEVELWMFGGTTLGGGSGSGVPHFSPASLRPAAAAEAHPTTTATHTVTTVTQTATAAHTLTQPARIHRRSVHRPERHRRATRHRTRASARSTAVTTTATATATPGMTIATGTSTAPKVVSSKPSSRRASAGSATPLVAGGVLIVILAAAGGFTAWRRRLE